jgi:hypothetical protein
MFSELYYKKAAFVKATGENSSLLIQLLLLLFLREKQIKKTEPNTPTPEQMSAWERPLCLHMDPPIKLDMCVERDRISP